MRRLTVLFAVGLVLVVAAAPAVAAPENSPAFESYPVEFHPVFPNPCLGDDVLEPWHFVGVYADHEFTNPSGRTHYNNVGYLTAWTDSGYSMPERMIGIEVENFDEGEEHFTYAGTGLYQLKNGDGQKLRLQIKIHLTIVDGEVVVEAEGWDFVCLGKGLS